jgi:hypothetical protein
LILVDKKISIKELQNLARNSFGDMVKAVVDINKKIIVTGGELHSDEETFLLDMGSNQTDLWGVNIYPFSPKTERIEFDSLINIRPRQGNYSRNVEDPAIIEIITDIINDLVSDD